MNISVSRLQERQLREMCVFIECIHSPDIYVFILGIRFWKYFSRSMLQRTLGYDWDIYSKILALIFHIIAESLASRMSAVLSALHSLYGLKNVTGPRYK